MTAKKLEYGRPALLVIVRHAESQRNEAKKGQTYFADDAARNRIKGIADHKIKLTDEGWKQARLTGKEIKKRFGTFDYVYTSGYVRTEETLDAILESYSKKEIESMQRRANSFIRERDPGYTYDMTETEAKISFPWLKDYWNTFGGFFSAPPGGESLAAVCERVYLFLHSLKHDRDQKRILVVTHGGTIRCFRALIERWDYDRATKWPEGHSPKNCGITVYESNPKKNYGKYELKEYNTVAY